MVKTSCGAPLWHGIVSVSVFVAGVLAATVEARGVILYSTPTRNTSDPSSSDGADAWNLEATWGNYLATPIDATHFIGAKHVTPNSTVTFRGVSYSVNLSSRATDAGSDLCIYTLNEGYTFPAYATLYNTSIDGSEIDETMTVIGRGTQRGGEVIVGSTLKGWLWGTSDGVQSWGKNIVSSFENYSSTSTDSLLCFNFDANGIANEAMLSVGDSSGAVFIYSQGQWKLAGINFAVSGPFSYTGEGVKKDGFNAAIFDAQGLYYWDSGWKYDSIHEPGLSAASRISARLGWIQSVAPNVVVPEPSSLLLFGIGAISLLAFAWKKGVRNHCYK